MSGTEQSQGSSTKISTDIIKTFKGEGDICAWLKKVELVVKLTGVKDEALFIPLYLEGGALAVYMEMEEVDQKDASKIKEKLIEAFSDSVFMAYTKLTGAKWTGEAVDIYVNELRRLAGLAGFTGTSCEPIVKLAFVTGFPDDISTELQQIPNIKQVHMTEVLNRARILVANRGMATSVAAVSLKDKDKENYSAKGQYSVGYPRRDEKYRAFSGKCFHCQGAHMIKDCPEKPVRRGVVCYRCGEEGHISTGCNQKQSHSQGNC